jgi:hypothetical protein
LFQISFIITLNNINDKKFPVQLPIWSWTMMIAPYLS